MRAVFEAERVHPVPALDRLAGAAQKWMYFLFRWED